MQLSPLRMSEDFFIDEVGRRVILRGFNLGGDCKVPYPHGGTNLPTDFADHATVSFVGRPFPLEKSHEHFARLKGWGCNVVRLLATWEAVEHAGPGIYDNDYLDFYAELCRRAGEAGMYVLIDFHQDVWSRMSGGDGAPCWTFEKAGIDYRNIAASGSARVMQFDYDYGDSRPFQDEAYPAMCWQNNNRLAAAAIMWTLFFAGKDFAPGLLVDGVSIEEFLQERYCACLREVARRVAGLPNVLGFDTLNEPGSGWIGVSMDKRFTKRSDYRTMPGIALAPVECLFAAQGNPVRAPELAVSFLRGGIVRKRYVVVNENRVPLWLAGHADPFLEAGAWEVARGSSYRVLRNDYFERVGGRRVSFERDYYVPFAHRVAATVRGVRDDWLLFANVDASRYYYEASLPAGLPERTINASHWYDGLTLITKKFHYPLTIDGVRRKLAFGKKGITTMFASQLARFKSDSRRLPGGAPTFLGEFGIPYNLRGGRAYRAWVRGRRGPNVWKEHITALDCVYGALEANLLHGAQWVYTATNQNDPRIGDAWNQEDFSVFSRDQIDDPANLDSGGRACEGFVRPYARRTQGLPLAMRFDRRRGSFALRFEADSAIPAPTELFVPRLQYPRGFTVSAPGCDIREDPDEELVFVTARASGETTIFIERKR